MGTLASDSFNRANAGNLGANWTDVNAGFDIVSNKADVPQSGVGATFYNGVAWPADQWSETTLGTVATISDEGEGPCVGLHTGTNGDLYLAQGNAVETRLYKRVGNSYTKLGSDGPACATGAVLRLSRVGTTLTLTKDGSNICGTPLTDSAISAGNAGMWGGASAVRATVTLWQGGGVDAGPVTSSDTSTKSATDATQKQVQQYKEEDVALMWDGKVSSITPGNPVAPAGLGMKVTLTRSIAG